MPIVKFVTKKNSLHTILLRQIPILQGGEEVKKRRAGQMMVSSSKYLLLVKLTEECKQDTCCNCTTDNTCNVRTHSMHQKEVRFVILQTYIV